MLWEALNEYEALKNYEHWSGSWNNGNELDGLSFSVEIERKEMLTKLFSLAKIGSKVNAQQYEASIFLFEVLQIVMCRILYCFQKLDMYI